MLLWIAYILDFIIVPLKIEWKHNYRRERIQLYPSVEFCKKLSEGGTVIDHGTTYPGYFDWVLYDGNDIVVKYGAREFDESQTEFLDSVDIGFYDRVDHYIESHKYFSLFLWMLKKQNPIRLDPEHIK